MRHMNDKPIAAGKSSFELIDRERLFIELDLKEDTIKPKKVSLEPSCMSCSTTQRHILIPLLLSVFIALLGIGIIVPVMPVFAASLGAGGLALGFIIAAFSITRGFCQPLVGNLSDRWGRKGFLVCGLTVYALVGLLIPEANSVGKLVLIRTLHGVGSAMIVPIAMAYVSDLAPMGSEGRYMGWLALVQFNWEVLHCEISMVPCIAGGVYYK